MSMQQERHMSERGPKYVGVQNTLVTLLNSDFEVYQKYVSFVNILL